MEKNLKSIMEDSRTVNGSFTISVGQDKKLREFADKFKIKKSQIISKMLEDLDEEKLVALFTK